MDCASTVARRRTTHSEDEDQQDEEEEDALVATHHSGPPHAAIAPFHYLINEQAKSIVALQELQNEVGALLEFRDLVMETFPHLRQKTTSGSTPRLSHMPVVATSLHGGKRDWEPGVRVKRKLHQHSRDQDSLAAPRSRSNSHGKGPKSAGPAEVGANSGTSSAGSSAVQDSGFCAESKEHCSSSTSTTATSTTASASASASAPRKGGDQEADDELWNLLDIIHVKGTRLRLEVEHLQQKLQKREPVTPPGFRRRSRSLELVTNKGGEQPDRIECRLSLESEMRALKQERDVLLDRIADMEAENLANLARTDRLLAEMGVLSAEKRDLERQLRIAKASACADSCGRDSRLRTVASSQMLVGEGSCFAPVGKDAFIESGLAPLPAADDYLKQEDGFRIEGLRPPDPVSERLASAEDTPRRLGGVQRPDDADGGDNSPDLRTPKRNGRCRMKLGTLDGIVSSPSPRMKGARGVTPDKKKTAAILAEFNAIELQRHLLVTTFQNQIANNRIDRLSRSYVDIHHQLEKFKEENDDLRFQLEEKSIELEGTRARIRLLERLQSAKLTSSAELNETVVSHSNTLLPPSHESTPNPILPQIALPVGVVTVVDESNAHHSSSTESAHHEDEDNADEKRTESAKKRPPSKIPLKSYTAPKPPTGRTGKSSVVVPPLKGSNDKLKEAQSMVVGRSKSRETPSMQSRSRESSAGGRGGTSAGGSRESLREPRRARKTSTQEGSFSSTGSSHSVRTHTYPSSSPSSKKTASLASASRDRASSIMPPADQSEHKKLAPTVVKEPERFEKTEEFLDSLDNGRELSMNSNNSTFLKPSDNQELDRSLCSVAQSRAWRVTTPQANSQFFDSIDNTTSGFNQSMCLSDREAMAESDSLEPSCSDSGDLV